MISLEKLKILAHTQKLPKTVEDLSKLIVAKGFKKLPKVQKIAKSGHTDLGWCRLKHCLVIDTSCCRPECCWLGLGYMSIGDPNKSH